MVTLAELEELAAFVRFGRLPAAIVRHVAANHEPERSCDIPPGAPQSGWSAADSLGPHVLGYAVESSDVASQIGVRLPLLLAIRAESGAHAAGVHVIGEQERCVQR